MVVKRCSSTQSGQKILCIIMSLALNKLKKRSPSSDVLAKPKRKIDRFDGLTEEEVQKYTLDDILEPNLDLVFVGINPGLMSAHRGRYYAGPGNHFYKLLHESGLVPRFVSYEEDRKLLNYKIGLTNIVARATRSSADLKKSEIKEGSILLRRKLEILKPRVAIFNGKCIYEVFADITAKSEFHFGLQKGRVGETVIWVVPSSSARCANFPRMTDKLHFYLALKKYIAHLNGEITHVDTREFIFEGKCKQSIPSTSRMWRRKGVSAFLHGGRIANKETVCLDTSEENVATVKSTEFVVTEILGGNDEDQREGTLTESEINLSEHQNSDLLERMKKSPIAKMNRDTNRIKKNCLKRSWKQSPLSYQTSSVNKSKSSDDTMDFMNLIKQRLVEKKDKVESEEKIVENSVEQPIGGGKKLKYANLKLNIGKKLLNVNHNLPDPFLRIKDSNTSGSSDEV